MQTIASHLQDKSIALYVYTETFVTEFVERAKERMNEDRGQAAIEYGGILVIIGLIFSALFALKIPSHVRDWAKAALDHIDSGAKCTKDC
jgi:Flp pilus assembly pilin Flp